MAIEKGAGGRGKTESPCFFGHEAPYIVLQSHITNGGGGALKLMVSSEALLQCSVMSTIRSAVSISFVMLNVIKPHYTQISMNAKQTKHLYISKKDLTEYAICCKSIIVIVPDIS